MGFRRFLTHHLFLCGTEVGGSCQSVNGTPSLNKCLMGYAATPYVLLVALKDVNGTLLARCILKLLLEEVVDSSGVSYKPILFLERPYPTDSISNEELTLLLDAAKEKAKELGVPLAVKHVRLMQFLEQDQLVSVSVCSLGCSVPYEYADAAHGESQDGKYKFSAYILPD